MSAEHIRIGLGERDLAGSGSSLAFLKLQRLFRQAQNRAAQRNRAGRNHQHLDACVMKRCNILPQAFQPVALEAGCAIHQKGGPDFDNDAAIVLQFLQHVSFPRRIQSASRKV